MSNTQDPIKSALSHAEILMRRPNVSASEVNLRATEIVNLLHAVAASPQPPGFDAHDMATAAADGFRDGVASVQPPGDAREAFEEVYAQALKDSGPGTIKDIARLCWQAATAQASEPSAEAPLLHEFLDEAERTGVTHLNEYGSTDLPQEIVGVSMTDGEKRLARLLMIALGIRHPAFDDFVALLMSKTAAPARAVEPLTVFEGFLCCAWGETDLPAAELVPDWEGVRRFMAREWLGAEDATDYDGTNTLERLKADFDAHEEDKRGGPLTCEFEIGGVSVERVCAHGITTTPAAKAGKDGGV